MAMESDRRGTTVRMVLTASIGVAALVLCAVVPAATAQKDSRFERPGPKEYPEPKPFNRGHRLSDGYEDVVPHYNPSFSCEGRIYGYYADMEHECKVFHICNPIKNTLGKTIEMEHFSFFCGEGTVFDQEHLVCNFPYASLPCPEAGNFYDIKNAEFAVPEKKSDHGN